VLAQRAVADSPRWTRAVGIIPATPYPLGSSLRPCLGQGASWRARAGRVRRWPVWASGGFKIVKSDLCSTLTSTSAFLRRCGLAGWPCWASG